MAKFLFSYRIPMNYTPGGEDAMAAWTAWFESIDSNEHTVMRQRRFKYGRDGWVGNQRARAPEGLSIIVVRGVDQNAARPQQPRLDADLDPHALHGAGKRFLYRFGIIDRLPEPLRALETRHIAGL